MYKTFKNILNKKQKNNLLKFIKKEVKNLGPIYPCLQTDPYIHLKNEMKDFNKKIKKYIEPYKIHKSWGVCSKGDVIAWHQHLGTKYSFVYYLHNPDNVGTMFLNPTKHYNLVEYSKGIENTLIRFEGTKLHSTPNTYKKTKRYTIAFDII